MSEGRLKTDLRITAGTLRGRRVPIPRDQVRPTSERARQAYFNIVTDRLPGAHFLDLFAGSGIFSFEALSRGASSATAIDTSRESLTNIRKTADAFGLEIETILGDVPRVNLTPAEPFTLVYADPPYDFGQYDELLLAIDRMPVSDDAVVAVEHRRHTTPFTVEPGRLAFWRRAEYGEIWMTFFAAAPGLQ